MDAARSLHATREQFTRDVRQVLGQVPPAIADSAVGHAVLAEVLVQIAADILKRQDNAGFLGHLVAFIARDDAGFQVKSAGKEWGRV